MTTARSAEFAVIKSSTRIMKQSSAWVVLSGFTQTNFANNVIRIALSAMRR